MIDRPLTGAQLARLDLLAREDPDARVIGWDARYGAPVIRNEQGRKFAVNSHGRLIASRAARAGA